MALFCPSFIRKQDDASGPIWCKTDLSYGLVGELGETRLVIRHIEQIVVITFIVVTEIAA